LSAAETVDLSAAFAGEETKLKAARQAATVSKKKDFFMIKILHTTYQPPLKFITYL
jgi:hypothetical protein